MVLTTNVSAAFPLINETGATWAGSFPYQWMTAGALTRETEAGCPGPDPGCQRLAAIADFARAVNVGDLVTRAPDIVLIDNRQEKSYIPGDRFDYVTDMRRDPRFEDAWKHYRKIDTILDYDVWLRDLAGTPE
jgi:hypothetical protein